MIPLRIFIVMAVFLLLFLVKFSKERQKNLEEKTRQKRVEIAEFTEIWEKSDKKEKAAIEKYWLIKMEEIMRDNPLAPFSLDQIIEKLEEEIEKAPANEQKFLFYVFKETRLHDVSRGFCRFDRLSEDGISINFYYYNPSAVNKKAD